MPQSSIPAHIETLLEVYLRQRIRLGMSIDPKHLAYRWVKSSSPSLTHGGELEPINANLFLSLDDLKGIDTQKEKLVKNTRQFLAGIPANHVLMTGASGSGKSSLIRALLREFHEFGLRVIEVARDDLFALGKIREAINNLPEDNGCRYIIYCDDLSLNGYGENYRVLKSILDGALDSEHDKLLVYATSNDKPNPINPSETVDRTMNETISLSDRFGLWLSFEPMEQLAYIDIAQHYIESYDIEWNVDIMEEALTFATNRGGQSGRVAYQFVRQYVGDVKLSAQKELERIKEEEEEAIQIIEQQNKFIRFLLPHLDKIASHSDDDGKLDNKEVFMIIGGIVGVFAVIIIILILAF